MQNIGHSSSRRSGPASASTLRSDDWGIPDVAQYQHTPTVQGRSSGSPRRTSTSKLRQLHNAYDRTGGDPPQLPDDFPAGPFASISMHMDHVKGYAKNPKQGGGIFIIREKEHKVPARNRGPTARLVCNREGRKPFQTGVVNGLNNDKRSRKRGSIRCGCKWSVTLELVAGPHGVPQ